MANLYKKNGEAYEISLVLNYYPRTMFFIGSGLTLLGVCILIYVLVVSGKSKESSEFFYQDKIFLKSSFKKKIHLFSVIIKLKTLYLFLSKNVFSYVNIIYSLGDY